MNQDPLIPNGFTSSGRRWNDDYKPEDDRDMIDCDRCDRYREFYKNFGKQILCESCYHELEIEENEK